MVRFTVTTITACLLYFCMTNLFYTTEAFDRNIEGFSIWFFARHVPTTLQDESRNISENSTWGIKRKFEQGKVVVNHKKFLGYDKDEEGNLIIN